MLAGAVRVNPIVLSLPVVLASASPRRQELLRRLVTQFRVVAADVDEDALTTADPVETAQRLALEKALVVARREASAIVIGGDTVVELEGRQFAKPASEAEAAAMLAALSGRTHRVISGLAVVWPGGSTVLADATDVTFRRLGAHEIDAYVATGEPMDKAGAYAIQGGAASFVVRVHGDIDTVVGMPVAKLAAVLRTLRPIGLA